MKQAYQKLANFRDLGGLRGADGKAVKRNRLLRSGELSKVTEDDIKTLKEVYQLHNIVDLRTKNERNSAPDMEIPGTVYYSLDFFQGEDDGQATGSAEQLQQMQSKEQVDRKMKELYTAFVVSAGARQKMYELLQLLLNTAEGSTLIHCFAGKDRTGIFAAVILTILGVSKEDIAADYLKTNQLRKKENKELLGQLRAAKVPEPVLEAVRQALCVRQEYLETSYEAAEQKYGSFEQYILEGIGFGQEKWAQLREMYLVETEEAAKEEKWFHGCKVMKASELRPEIGINKICQFSRKDILSDEKRQGILDEIQDKIRNEYEKNKVWALLGGNTNEEYICLQVAGSLDIEKEIICDIKCMLPFNKTTDVKPWSSRFHKNIFEVEYGLDAKCQKYNDMLNKFSEFCVIVLDEEKYLENTDTKGFEKTAYVEVKYAYDTKALYWNPNPFRGECKILEDVEASDCNPANQEK